GQTCAHAASRLPTSSEATASASSALPKVTVTATSWSAPAVIPALSRRRVGDLHLGEELIGVLALLLGAVARALGAAEGHVEIDARRRHVDHHHAGLGIALEMRGMLERGGDDTGRQAELGVVGGRQRLLV